MPFPRFFPVIRMFFVGILLAGLANAAGGREPRTSPLSGYPLADRVEVGLRLTYFWFRDVERATEDAGGRKGGYAPGISTYSLKEEQAFLPNPYIRFLLTSNLGLELTWGRIEGATRTRDVETLIPYSHSNGNPVLRGPGLSLYARYPIDLDGYVGRVTPFVSAGLVFFRGSFTHDPDWHAGGRRNMAVDDTTGLVVMLGSSVWVADGWEIELSVGHVRARPDARYWMNVDSRPRAEWTFPMDSWRLQLGLKYTF